MCSDRQCITCGHITARVGGYCTASHMWCRVDPRSCACGFWCMQTTEQVRRIQSKLLDAEKHRIRFTYGDNQPLRAFIDDQEVWIEGSTQWKTISELKFGEPEYPRA